MKQPWLCHFLKNIADIYSTEMPGWIIEAATPDDISYIERCVRTSDFDTLGLQRAMYDGLKDNTVTLRVYSCMTAAGYIGKIYILSEREYPWVFPFKEVARVFQLFHDPAKPARALFFGNRTLRIPPAVGYPIERKHINGGYAMPCDPNTIVVYRREEALRVFIHEFLHASCSDPHELEVEHVEADTEAWAELVLCGLASKGKPALFKKLFNHQMEYAVEQGGKLFHMHNVKDDSAYAWRYTIGKFYVWRRLGFNVPVGGEYDGTPLRSLRLTKELE